MEYANASKVLPKELVAEIKCYFPGGMLFVSKEDFDRNERASLVVKLVEKNVPVDEIAQLAEVTPRHVRRLKQTRGGVCGGGADGI
ncbi:MAG TPA: hypothetical protein PLK80_05835 [bacterium]|nr:MAG: hypothetical protein BWY28_03233 [bacterium ADurb.Bin236]HOY63552.1 hypothetical protein [bacterium]HPI76236.1 hypothetical protein [bacterium]